MRYIAEITKDIFKDPRLNRLSSAAGGEAYMLICYKIFLYFGFRNGIVLGCADDAELTARISKDIMEPEVNVEIALMFLISSGLIIRSVSQKYQEIKINPPFDMSKCADTAEEKKTGSEYPDGRPADDQNENGILPEPAAEESKEESQDCGDKKEDETGEKKEKKVFVTLTTSDGTWDVTEENVELYRSVYPGTDVERELKNMEEWLRANPDKTKDRNGMIRFVNNWLAKAMEKGGSAALTANGSKASTMEILAQVAKESGIVGQ